MKCSILFSKEHRDTVLQNSTWIVYVFNDMRARIFRKVLESDKF